MSSEKRNDTNVVPEEFEHYTGEMQLGDILRDVGLISQERLDELLKSSEQAEVSFGDLLRREVNVENLKALLTYDIPMPFAKPKTKPPGVAARPKVVSEGVTAEGPDVARILEQGQLQDDDILPLLLSRNIVSENDVQSVIDCCSHTGLPLWRILLNKKLVSYDQVSDLVKGHLKQDAVQEKEELVVDLLTSSGLLKHDVLEAAREEQMREKGSLITILIERRAITIDDIGKAMEKVLNIPYVSLKKRVIDPLMAFVLPEHVVK